MNKIVPLKQKSFTRCLCKSVGEAIAEVQARSVSAPLAEVPISFARDARLSFRNWLNVYLGCTEEIVEATTRNRIPVGINHGGRFQKIDCRNAQAFRSVHCFGARPGLGLVAKYGHDRRSV